MVLIKIEAHLKELKPEYQGNAPAGFHAKAATESIKVVAHVDEKRLPHPPPPKKKI